MMRPKKNGVRSRRARACPSPCPGARERSRGTGPRATVTETLAGETRSDARMETSEGPALR